MTASPPEALLVHADLLARYHDALRSFVADGAEDTLFEAYETARCGLSARMTVATLSSIHHCALASILHQRADIDIALERAEAFLTEAVTVFDMAITGFQTNTEKLLREIQERKIVEEELRSVTFELAFQRDKLDEKVKARTAELRQRALELEGANHRLRSTNQEQAEFTYALSHDLKTPINTIGMMLDMMVEEHTGEIPASALDMIGMATTTADRMKRLIDDVLEYSRIVEHRFEPQTVDLELLYSEAVADLGEAIAQSGAHLDCGDLPKVRGSAFQLGMLLKNLLSNALKYRAEDRRPRIAIRAETAEDGGDVILSVRDNGIGIPPERCSRIFELFKRLHTFDQFHGSGIGLALCKRVADNHGTRIEIVSEVGVGSTFSIALRPAKASP